MENTVRALDARAKVEPGRKFFVRGHFVLEPFFPGNADKRFEGIAETVQLLRIVAIDIDAMFAALIAAESAIHAAVEILEPENAEVDGMKDRALPDRGIGLRK